MASPMNRTAQQAGELAVLNDALRHFVHTDHFNRLPQLNASWRGKERLEFHVPYNAPASAHLFKVPVAATLVAATLMPSVAGSDGGAVTLNVEKIASGTALGAGVDLLSSTLNLKSTAATAVAGAISSTAGVADVAAGQYIASVVSGTTTAAAGVLVLEFEADAASVANLDWELAGTNATNGSAVFADGGGVTLTTGATTGDQCILQRHADTNISGLADTQFNTNDKPVFAQRVKFGGSVSDVVFWAGFKLTNTPVVATDADQAFFRFEDSVNGAKLQAVWSIGGTDYTADLKKPYLLAAGDEVNLAIYVGDDRVARFYVDGQLEAMSSAQGAAGALTADVDLVPFVGIQTKADAAKSLTTRHLATGKTHND